MTATASPAMAAVAFARSKMALNVTALPACRCCPILANSPMPPLAAHAPAALFNVAKPSLRSKPRLSPPAKSALSTALATAVRAPSPLTPWTQQAAASAPVCRTSTHDDDDDEPTTEAPRTTTRFTCPAYRPCRCKPGSVSMDFDDSRGCKACSCVEAGDVTTTKAPATTRATTTKADETTRATTTTTTQFVCPTFRPCNCKTGSVSVVETDAKGCMSCSCQASAGTTRAPATTRRTTTTTTTEEATTEATTTRFVCPTFRPCNCKTGSVSVVETDAKGCMSCSCQASAGTTRAPATTRRTTTTTTKEATTEATTTRFVCPTFRPCNCKTGSKSVQETDRNGCLSCSCQASSATTQAPATTRAPRPTTTKSATTTRFTCPTFRPCNCKPGSVAVEETDRDGCLSCSCVSNGAPASTTTRGSATRPTTRTSPKGFVNTCNCKRDAVRVYESVRGGCPTCSCQTPALCSAGETFTGDRCSCSDDCFECEFDGSAGACQVCKNGKALFEGACVDSCPSGFEVAGEGSMFLRCIAAGDEPTNEPTDDPTDDPTDEATEEPTEDGSGSGSGDAGFEEPTSDAVGATNEPTDEPTNEPTNEPTDEPTEEATTEAPVTTTTRPRHCGVYRPCRCKDYAEPVDILDSRGCNTCTCQLKPGATLPTIPATTRRATRGTTTARDLPPTTEAATTRRATRATTTTKAAPATTRFMCPAYRPCNCKAGSKSVIEADADGCFSCSCQADGSVTTRAAPAPAPATTRRTYNPACPAVRQCRCKPGAQSITITNSRGCDECRCVLPTGQVVEQEPEESSSSSTGAGAAIGAAVAGLSLVALVIAAVVIRRRREASAAISEEASELEFDESL
eukprot:TRINITY_DN10945_c1_g1_i6.p1 TRINITY_DN10945_c1_g1~~TRINITY_DN10945_c1_g1_i6.p1  ORF type:complete len:856 (+),score=193.92 TRINITY_DN10945_c1_g1_i6:159-2726(+)